MSHYSDPTASAAVGSIDREFSRLEKKAKRLRERFEAGHLSPDELDAAEAQFRGIYRCVLRHEFYKPHTAAQTERSDPHGN